MQEVKLTLDDVIILVIEVTYEYYVLILPRVPGARPGVTMGRAR